MKRFATAVWNGSGRNGRGYIVTQSKGLDEVRFSFDSRFSGEEGTNPEELLAAAHASCFIMKLSFVLEGLGYLAELLHVTCYITMDKGIIASSHLELKAIVPGITDETFQGCVKEAEMDCIVGRALRIKISLQGALAEE